MFAGSFSRSMAAKTVSVTPLAASVTGGRTSAFIWSEGQLPAAAADTPTSVDPAVMPARTRYRPKHRPVMPSNMFVVSSVRRSRREVATVLRLDQTLAERKCRMALESIRNGYRWRGRRSMFYDFEEAGERLNILRISLALQMSSQKRTGMPLRLFRSELSKTWAMALAATATDRRFPGPASSQERCGPIRGPRASRD